MIKSLDEKTCQKLSGNWSALKFALMEYPAKEGNAYYAVRDDKKQDYIAVATPSFVKKQWFDVLLNRRGEIGFWKISTVELNDDNTISQAIKAHNEKKNISELVFD